MSPRSKSIESLTQDPFTAMTSRIPENAHVLVRTALQKKWEEQWEQYALLGPEMSRSLDEFVVEQTVRTIQDWYSVDDEGKGGPDPNPYALLPPFDVTNVSGGLTQRNVDHWVNHWWFKGLLFENGDVRALKTAPNELDAASEHRQLVEETRRRKNQ